MAPWRPQVDMEKYKQAILYLLNSPANNVYLGKVKLFKLLYYLDFDHYQAYKTPITGDTYRKLPYGPVPKSAQQVLLEMQADELLSVSSRWVSPYSQYVFTARAKPSLSAFTDSEREILERVVAKWANHTTNDIVMATHGEAPWQAVEMGAEIPYDLAFYRHQLDEETYADEEIEELGCAYRLL